MCESNEEMCESKRCVCALLAATCVVRAWRVCVRTRVLGRRLTLPFWSDQAYANTGCTFLTKAISHFWRFRLAEAAEHATVAVAMIAFRACKTPWAMNYVQAGCGVRVAKTRKKCDLQQSHLRDDIVKLETQHVQMDRCCHLFQEIFEQFFVWP